MVNETLLSYYPAHALLQNRRTLSTINSIKLLNVGQLNSWLDFYGIPVPNPGSKNQSQAFGQLPGRLFMRLSIVVDCMTVS